MSLRPVTESISGAPRETVSEQQAYDLLRAHGHHQKTSGKDYWFWQQRLDKRAAEVGVSRRRGHRRAEGWRSAPEEGGGHHQKWRKGERVELVLTAAVGKTRR